MSRITKDIVEMFPNPAGKNALGNLSAGRWTNFGAWLPLLFLPAMALIFRHAMNAWIFMWVMAFALYFGCKWLTWQRCKVNAPAWRNAAYLFLWPGMDAPAFLDARRLVTKPQLREWIAAVLKTCLGAWLVWGIVPLAANPLLTGWIGLVGFVFLLHFGTFHLLALAWQQLGVDAQPIMRSPMLAKSLADFWGRRWNSAFNLLVHRLVFRKLLRPTGPIAATLMVFFVSGMIHDLVISVPAHAGYGLPTLYFMLQGVGLCVERRTAHERPTPGRAFGRRLFTVVITAVPAFWLFHPPFIRNVILPMLHAIGAT